MNGALRPRPFLVVSWPHAGACRLLSILGRHPGVLEVGSVHLDNGAVRFDRGRDCRQPLRSEEVLSDNPDLFFKWLLADAAVGHGFAGLGFVPDPLNVDLDTNLVLQAVRTMPRVSVVFIRRGVLRWYVSRIRAVHDHAKRLLEDSTGLWRGIRIDLFECKGVFRVVKAFEDRLLGDLGPHRVLQIDYEEWGRTPQSIISSVLRFMAIPPGLAGADIGLPSDEAPARAIGNHSELRSTFANTEWRVLFEH
jgi:hypothetical protein